MPLTGLVYSSKATVPFDNAALQVLSDDSAANNADIGVTGYLHFHGGCFMQYIEGEGAIVEALMERIARDERHHIQRVLREVGRETRRFPCWNMQWLREEHMTEIRLEHILYDFMQLKTSPVTAGDPTVPHVWRLVDKIAASRQRLFPGRSVSPKSM